MLAGFVLDLVGVGGIGTGAAMSSQQNPAVRTAGGWVALGGVATLLFGTILRATSSSHVEDAAPTYYFDSGSRVQEP